MERKIFLIFVSVSVPISIIVTLIVLFFGMTCNENVFAFLTFLCVFLAGTTAAGVTVCFIKRKQFVPDEATIPAIGVGSPSNDLAAFGSLGRESDSGGPQEDAENVYAVEQESSLRPIGDTRTSSFSSVYTAEIRESYIAHELRTALTGIVSVVPLLRATPLSQEQSSLVDLIDISGTHMMLFLNSTLEYAKDMANTKRTPKAKQVVDVRTEVEATVLMCAPTARAKGLDLNVYVARDVPTIQSDRVCLRQILVNLLHNALKFTSEGYVAVRCGLMDEAIVIEVHDSGPGMTSEVLQKLSTPSASKYITTEEQRQHGGTGLGMTFVHSMVKRLGGVLSVRSIMGVGSTFIVTIPCGVKDTFSCSLEIGVVEACCVLVLTRRLSSSSNDLITETEQRTTPHNNTVEMTWEGALVRYLQDVVTTVLHPTTLSELRAIDMSTVNSVVIASDCVTYYNEEGGSDIGLSRIPKEHILVIDRDSKQLLLPSHIDKWLWQPGHHTPSPPSDDILHQKRSSPLMRAPPLHYEPSPPISPRSHDAMRKVSIFRQAFQISSSHAQQQPVTPPTSQFNSTSDNGAPNLMQDVPCLIADDDFISRRVMEKLFVSLGAVPTCVSTGREALAAVQASPSKYHIVFMDVEMPDMDGPTAARGIQRLRRTEELPPIPIVGLSGHDEGEALRMFGGDAVACLMKPITAMDIYQAHSEAVHKSSTQPLQLS